MASSEGMRTKRYAAKLDPGTSGLRADAMKKQQAGDYNAVVAKQVRTRHEVAQLVAGQASGFDLVNYLGFANGILKAMKRHAGGVVCAEVQILKRKHAARGQNALILDDIINYYVPVCYVAPPPAFRLDVSLLDGPDVLV